MRRGLRRILWQSPRLEQPQFMTEVEIARVEAVSRGGVGVHAGISFLRCTSIVTLGISALPPKWSK
jgi:hypothetical protein